MENDFCHIWLWHNYNMLITSFIKEADCGSADEIIRGETPGKRWRSLKPADVSAVFSSLLPFFSFFLLLVFLISSRFGVLRARINCPNVADKDPSHGGRTPHLFVKGRDDEERGIMWPTHNAPPGNWGSQWKCEENTDRDDFTDQTGSSRYLPIINITSTQDCVICGCFFCLAFKVKAKNTNWTLIFKSAHGQILIV